MAVSERSSGWSSDTNATSSADSEMCDCPPSRQRLRRTKPEEEEEQGAGTWMWQLYFRARRPRRWRRVGEQVGMKRGVMTGCTRGERSPCTYLISASVPATASPVDSTYPSGPCRSMHTCPPPRPSQPPLPLPLPGPGAGGGRGAAGSGMAGRSPSHHGSHRQHQGLALLPARIAR
eukprot:2034134-Rhodomonas_salina.1